MARPGVTIVADRRFHSWVRGFSRLPAEAAVRAKGDFDQAVEMYFSATQEVVHIITGNLKASGRIVETEVARNRLTAHVIYGDDEVDYAVYENARGGEHAFMEIGWEQAQAQFDEVMPRTWQEVVGSW